jgi:uncharacterized protein
MAGFSLDQCNAVITGASSGLGIEFARQLAPRCSALMLVARRQAELDATAELVKGINSKVQTTVCVADLSNEAGRKEVVEKVSAWRAVPNLLINNAGLGDYGRFDMAEAERISAQIEVNISSLTLLTRHLLPVMSRPAGVLNVSSLAGTLFMPELAVYAATKAYVTSFSEALSLELACDHVTVSAVCPGPTPTSFSKTARRADGSDTNRSGQGVLRQMPERVVADGLRALERGQPVVYPGVAVSLAGTLFRLLPRFLLRLAMGRRMTAP